MDVTDITRNSTNDDCHKLRACGGRTYVFQQPDYLSGYSNWGGRDVHGGRGCGGCGRHEAGRHNNSNDHPAIADHRNFAATNVTDIVEYDASTASTATQSTSSNDHGGRTTGGRFGPR